MLRMTLLAILGWILFSSCATVGPPSYILFTPGVESGGKVTIPGGVTIQVTATGYRLGAILRGKSCSATAKVYDKNGKQLRTAPTWAPSNPEVLSISPATGNVVTITGLKPGTSDILITASGLIHVVRNIRVE